MYRLKNRFIVYQKRFFFFRGQLFNYSRLRYIIKFNIYIKKVFHNLFQITSYIFVKTVTSNLKSKIFIQTKGKAILKMKNIAVLVQDNEKLVDRKK